jgi:LytR cell envelope-related transcriptional attenuator
VSLRPPGKSAVPRFRPVNKMRRVQAVVLSVALVGGAGAGAWFLGVKSKSGSRVVCQKAAYVPPAPPHTPVNVMNGTTQGGFAEQVADELRKRGFTIGAIGNDPLRRKIRGTGELRYGPEGADQVKALRPWELGMNPVPDPRRQGAEVDFVIGRQFTTLYDVARPLPGEVLPCAPSPQPTPTAG